MYRIIFLLFFTLNLQAQFSIEPSPSEGSSNASVAFFNADSEIHNNTDSTLNFVWKRITNELPIGWTSGICTNLGCLPPEVDEGTFFLESGYSVDFSCSFFPNDIAGNAIVIVNIWTEEDSSQVIQQTYFGNTDPTNIVETDIKDLITIFPNPIQESFSITQNEDIHKLEIYNSLGQIIKTYPFQSTYDFRLFPADLYFITVFDKQNEILTVLKLIKG
ncbi:MAG: T9SS type A sorting domain-containing protein [Saprospiraceae bacterium]